MRVEKKIKLNFNFLLAFSFSYCISAIRIISLWYILPFLIILVACVIFKIKWKIILISLLVGLIPSILYIWIKDINIFKYLQPGMDHLFHFSLKNYCVNLVDNSYDKLTSSILNLLLFNIKKSYSYDLYKIMVNLSIVYLIVISGFHLSLVQIIFKKIFNRHAIIERIVSNTFILLYTYLLSFSISTVRVILSNLVGIVRIKYRVSPYTKVSMAGIISLIICPSIIANYGFSMSYLCTIGVIYIYQHKIKNYFLNLLAINSLATFISLPFVLAMNEQISIFAIINSIIFSYFICFLFIIVLLIFWIKWIYPIQYYLVLALTYLVNCFNDLNILIQLPNWNSMYIAIYISTLMSSLLIYSKRYDKLN